MEDKEYKLISFDLDGTLLNSEKIITDNVKDAIMEAYNAGKIIVLATGRNIAELHNFRNIEAFRYAVAISGSYIYDLKEDKVLVTDPIPKESVDKLFEFLKINDIHVGAHSNEYYLDNEVLENPERHHIELLVNTLKTNGILVPSVYDLYYSKNMDIYKINMYLNSEDERTKIREELAQFENDFEIVYSDGYTLELSKKDVTKGNGLKYLCEKLGLDVSDIIAVGDNENDISALTVAGLGIAVSNACNSLKEIADVIVPTNDEDGCKVAIEKYLLKK